MRSPFKNFHLSRGKRGENNREGSLIIGVAAIFGCLAVGEGVQHLFRLPVPGSILGLVVLTLLLETGTIPLRDVKSLSSFLIANMGLFFVPPGVALMVYFEVIRNEWLPILVSVLVSTVLVFIVTGAVHQIIRRLWK